VFELIWGYKTLLAFYFIENSSALTGLISATSIFLDLFKQYIAVPISTMNPTDPMTMPRIKANLLTLSDDPGE
jgi:hypothetical protein